MTERDEPAAVGRAERVRLWLSALGPYVSFAATVLALLMGLLDGADSAWSDRLLHHVRVGDSEGRERTRRSH